MADVLVERATDVDKPLVSVILAVYNYERYLAEAIESVLAQSYRPIEIIVVDDGSTDGTAQVARSYEEVRYVHQTNQGHAAAMNAGIKAAQGEFIAFLDADDLWAPNKLSVQVDYLLQHPHVGYVIAKMQNFLEPGAQVPRRVTKDLQLSEYVALSLGTLVARKSVFELVGDFDTIYQYAKDVDWFVRAKEAGVGMGVMPEILLYRRLHESNRSYRTQARASEFLQVVKSAIVRKRDGDSGRELQKDNDAQRATD